VRDSSNTDAIIPSTPSPDDASFDAFKLDTLSDSGAGGTDGNSADGSMTTLDALGAGGVAGNGGERSPDGASSGSGGSVFSRTDAEADVPAVADTKTVADVPAAADTTPEAHAIGGTDGRTDVVGTDGTGGSGGTDGSDGAAEAGDASDPSQVGYWSFDETVAGHYADQWGSNDATGTGVTVNPNGVWGNAARLGTAAVSPATSYVSLPTNADIITTSYTLSLWIFPNDFGNMTNEQALVTWDGGGTDCNTSQNGFRLHITTSHLFLDPNCGGYNAQLVTPSDVQGKWNFVAVTISGSSWTMYLYNQGACTTPIANFPKTSTIAGFTGFASGGTWRFGASGTDHQLGFDGSIDEVHFWNRTLSQTELENFCTCNLTTCN
jgi:hypothetical protein